MQRRKFISSLFGGVAACWPLTARAQRAIPMGGAGELSEALARQSAIAKELEDKSRQLAALLSTCSEMRTPVNGVLGYTELMLDNGYGDTPDEIRDALERIKFNSVYLAELINRVFERALLDSR